MLEPKMTPVYDWNDIEDELCVLMGIDKELFRDYHKIVGGKYKDFWHVALESIIPDYMTNGSTVTLWRFEEDWFDDEKYTGENEWKQVMLKAWNQICERIDPNNNGIKVNFSW